MSQKSMVDASKRTWACQARCVQPVRFCADGAAWRRRDGRVQGAWPPAGL